MQIAIFSVAGRWRIAVAIFCIRIELSQQSAFLEKINRAKLLWYLAVGALSIIVVSRECVGC